MIYTYYHSDIKLISFHIPIKHVNYPAPKGAWASCFIDFAISISTSVNFRRSNGIFIIALYCAFVNCLNPSAKIFLAAFISLSCFTPHSGQTHSLTDRFLTSEFVYPQQLQA